MPRTKRKSKVKEFDRVKDFIERGQAAQAAVDAIIEKQPAQVWPSDVWKAPLPQPPSGDRVEKALAVLVKTLNKKLDENLVATLDSPHAYAEIAYVIPTGIEKLDAVFGVGGIPGGRLIEIWGPEHSLKSTLASWLLGAGQRLGLAAAKIDSEMSGTAEFETGLGVIPKRTLISQPDTLEQAVMILLDGIADFNKTKVPSLWVFDSLAASKLKAEIDASVDDNEAPGLRAKFLGQHLFPQLMPLLKAGLATVVIVNQARDSIGAGPWGKKTHSPGGRALRHYAHVRIEATPFGQIRKSEVAVGLKARFKAGKNKIAPPFREVVLDYFFTPPVLQLEGFGKVPVKRQPVILPQPVTS